MNLPPDIVDQHIDRALRREPDAGPPVDFARSVAARAGPVPAAQAGIERWLLRGLAAALVLSGLVVAAIHGSYWAAGFASLPLAGASTLSWGAALLACVAVSWSLDRLRPQRH